MPIVNHKKRSCKWTRHRCVDQHPCKTCPSYRDLKKEYNKYWCVKFCLVTSPYATCNSHPENGTVYDKKRIS